MDGKGRSPEWVARAQCCFGHMRTAESVLDREGRLPDFVTLSWPDARVIGQFREVGIPGLPYISFTNRMLGYDERWQPKWDAFRLEEYPELCIYDEKGVRERCIFADSNDPRRMDICQNTPELVDQMLREVRFYMETGASGLFIDHLYGVTRCCGEELGVHEHIYHVEDIGDYSEEYLRFAPGVEGPADDALGNFAYAMLLKRVQETMAEYGEDKVLFGNSTFWPFYYSAQPLKKFVMFAPSVYRRVPPIFWDYTDICLIESFMAVPGCHISRESDSRESALWGSQELWHKLSVIPEEYRALGRRQFALPGISGDRGAAVAEYVFASAKVYDLGWWTNPRSPGVDFVNADLGQQTEQPEINGDVWTRRYERGLAVANFGSQEADVDVSASRGLTDWRTGKAVGEDGPPTLRVAPEDGRILHTK